jgi:hypothetical protein
MDKDRSATQREVDDLLAQVDQETKAKAAYDKTIKQYELQLAELNVRAHTLPTTIYHLYRRKPMSKTGNWSKCNRGRRV